MIRRHEISLFFLKSANKMHVMSIPYLQKIDSYFFKAAIKRALEKKQVLR